MFLGDMITLVVLVIAVTNLVAFFFIAGVTFLFVNGLINRLIRCLALEKNQIYFEDPSLTIRASRCAVDLFEIFKYFDLGVSKRFFFFLKYLNVWMLL